MGTLQLFNHTSFECSKLVTRRYSTSFSLGVRLLGKSLRYPIHSIYGFVRFADEIVDTFHDHPKAELLDRFKADTYRALEEGISLNPILNSFQETVRRYNIDRELIDTFLRSMEMDLDQTAHDPESYDTYILGSAEVVGLMCLKIFCDGNTERYEALRPFAMKLGSAFQKINFLRDLKDDYEDLGRTYFPNVNMSEFNGDVKRAIETDIQKDFDLGLEGIRRLPASSRLGVYVAYVYYISLFKKIRRTSPSRIMETRIRVPNQRKFTLLLGSWFRHQLNLL